MTTGLSVIVGKEELRNSSYLYSALDIITRFNKDENLVPVTTLQLEKVRMLLFTTNF